MTIKEEIENEYFNWLYKIVCNKQYLKSKKISYRKLLAVLHSREFYFILPMDENRASDGINLRDEFADYLREHTNKWFDDYTVNEYLNGPCSVLEMMVALALRVEDEITGNGVQWFWLMIDNIGLNDMLDGAFDRFKVERAVNTLLDRSYDSDGRGGLFIVKHHSEDMRDVEIWYQMQWYLGEIMKV